MLIVSRSVLTLSLFALTVLVSASPTIEVTNLQVTRANPDGVQPDGTTVEFRLAEPDARVLRLSEESVIESWSDDTGANLLKSAEPPADAEGMGRVVSRVVGNIRHDRVLAIEGGSDILFTAVTPALPTEKASSMSIDGSLMLQVAGDGEKIVTLDGMSLDAGWGTDLNVNGKTLGCRLDSASGDGDERFSQFYGYGPELKPLRVVARESRNVSVMPAGDDRSNLIVVGSSENLTIDVVLA